MNSASGPVIEAILPAQVYEAYDAEGALLYVGTATNLASRLSAHKAGKPWWKDVARVTAKSYKTRDAALRAERKIIETRSPVHNITHSDRNSPAAPTDRSRVSNPDVIITAHRWEGGWELHQDGEAITQVTTLDKAVGQVRDYLDTVEPEVDHSDWAVEVRADLGPLSDEVDAARAATEAATAATAAAAKQARDAVRHLRDAGLSVTDSAVILGVSRGRVSQLVSA